MDMNHSEAVRLMAAEKYLLNELTPELREQFEAHFFECEECALDLRAGAAFVERSKEILAEPGRSTAAVARTQPTASGWLAWLRPAFAVPLLAVLLAVVGYQNLVTYPKLKETAAGLNIPQILPSASLIAVASRGGSRPAVSVTPNAPFLLFVDVPPEPHYSSYLAELRGPGGKPEWTLNISGNSVRDTLSIRVPGGRRDPGTYTLVMYGIGPDGQRAGEVGAYPFELRVSNTY